MRKISKLLATGLAAGVLMVGSANVQAAEATFGVDVVSAYVWRGLTVNRDTVVQPVLVVEPEGCGFGIEVWANFDIGDNNGQFEKREFSEIDFNVFYAIDLDPVTVTIGYTEYMYPGQVSVVDAEEEGGAPTTGRLGADREAYISVGTEIVGLDVALTVFQSMDASDGQYAVLSAGYGHEVVDRLTLGVNGHVSYSGKGAYNSTQNKAGLHDYLVGVSASYALSESCSVSVFANHVGTLDSDVLASSEIDRDFFGGVGVSHTF